MPLLGHSRCRNKEQEIVLQGFVFARVISHALHPPVHRPICVSTGFDIQGCMVSVAEVSDTDFKGDETLLVHRYANNPASTLPNVARPVYSSEL